MIPCKFHICQELIENHRNQRLVFFHWIVENIIHPSNMIFQDEKLFHPTLQNTKGRSGGASANTEFYLAIIEKHL